MKTSGRLMEFSATLGTLRVNYPDRLVSMLREVRQLKGMGYSMPAKINKTAETADQFYRYANILKQVLGPDLSLLEFVGCFVTVVSLFVPDTLEVSATYLPYIKQFIML